MNSEQLSISNLILNESFQRWVISPDEDLSLYWTAWQLEHPEYSEIFTEAQSILLKIHNHFDSGTNDERAAVWQNIERSIEIDTKELKKQLL